MDFDGFSVVVVVSGGDGVSSCVVVVRRLERTLVSALICSGFTLELVVDPELTVVVGTVADDDEFDEETVLPVVRVVDVVVVAVFCEVVLLFEGRLR